MGTPALPPSACPGPTTRREFLRAGGLVLGGLSLANLLEARESAGTSSAETSVILLYLHGGASHLETYDLKPNAPREYRSIFQPIATNVSGLEVAEHLPLHAKMADRFSIVRSMHHHVNIHSDGGIVVTTGKVPSKLDPTSQSKSEHPDFGSIVSRMRGSHPLAMPQYVASPSSFYFTRPTYLGTTHGAMVSSDPSARNYRPPIGQVVMGKDLERLQNRKGLIGQFDRFRKDLDQAENLAGVGEFQRRAFEMLTSTRTAEAFDLSKEPAELHERYGRHTWGQGCLLARRLAEHGTSVISLFIDSPTNTEEHTNWDDHPGNAGRIGDFGVFLERRLKYYDQALTALIGDIFERGLDRKILVVSTGEFGRTPKWRYDKAFNGRGRDHWPDAYSVLLSGGGLKMGQVVGATNSKGEYPTERPCTPQDLLATMYRHLGIDPAYSLNDHSGRPIPILSEGAAISELL